MNIKAVARVQVTVELDVVSLHGGMLGNEMFDAAATSAIMRVERCCSDFAKVVGCPKVLCILTEESK